MDRLGFIILSILKRGMASSRTYSMTVREIASAEDFGVKENTVFKKLRDFEKAGYITRGIKDGRAHTFIITNEGCRALEEERGKS
ncbi:MAG: hypothetical protein HFG80_10540 [Eubacterium sp.]|nr:hypothetical protein [Eubacterium sp.]